MVDGRSVVDGVVRTEAWCHYCSGTTAPLFQGWGRSAPECRILAQQEARPVRPWHIPIALMRLVDNQATVRWKSGRTCDRGSRCHCLPGSALLRAIRKPAAIQSNDADVPLLTVVNAMGAPSLPEAIASIACKQVSKWPRKQGLQSPLACQLADVLTCLLKGCCGLTQEPLPGVGDVAGQLCGRTTWMMPASREQLDRFPQGQPIVSYRRSRPSSCRYICHEPPRLYRPPTSNRATCPEPDRHVQSLPTQVASCEPKRVSRCLPLPAC